MFFFLDLKPIILTFSFGTSTSDYLLFDYNNRIIIPQDKMAFNLAKTQILIDNNIFCLYFFIKFIIFDT